MANQNYWLISVPEAGAKGKAFDGLQSQIGRSAKVFKFDVPELRVGTLDALMSLSDDLVKYDAFVEGVTRKIASQLYQMCEAGTQNQVALNVNAASTDVYLTHFKWDEAKYPKKPHLREICDLINSGVSKLDEELRNKVQHYGQLAHSIAAEERKQTGNLLTRDLTDLIQPDNIIDTEYLSTIYVVVPKFLQKDFVTNYETMTDFVVPRSSALISEDQEFALYSVVLFKRVVEDFKNLAREKRFTVRDFKYNPESSSGVENRKKLANEKDKAKNKLILWCRANFQEAFVSWIHIKAIRIFVESILRYGLPANFQAMLVLPNKKDDKNLRVQLNTFYKHLGSVHTQVGVEEESAPTSDTIYPYVYFPVNLDFASV